MDPWDLANYVMRHLNGSKHNRLITVRPNSANVKIMAHNQTGQN